MEENKTTITAESFMESLARQIRHQAHENHREVKDMNITKKPKEETA